MHVCIHMWPRLLGFLVRLITDRPCRHGALSRRPILPCALLRPGLSQQIQEVTVDWSEYTGIFDGFEVMLCSHQPK